MAHTFELKLRLGNALMQEPNDVATALRSLADKLDDTYELKPNVTGLVWDANGNSVGTWKVSRD